jgi:hypothetical protein
VHVTTTTPVLAEDDAAPDGPFPGGGTFIDPLVTRLHAQYGIDARVIRGLAVELLTSFAGARVQSFVPILVEKRLREICRSWA